jgi:hypothetical protein
MGLLDEAIREHLELKRRSGGDPAEIARKEQEALAPVFGEDEGAADGVALDGGPASLDAAAPLAPEDQLPYADGRTPETPPGDFSSVGEETAELDMQSVLGAEEMLTQEHPAPAPQAASGEDVGLEWEAPPGAGEAPPQPDPGQERLSFE